MESNRLIPSLLLFRTMSNFLAPSQTKPTPAERSEAIWFPRSEIENISAEKRNKMPLRSKLPPATHHLIRPEDKVRV